MTGPPKSSFSFHIDVSFGRSSSTLTAQGRKWIFSGAQPSAISFFSAVREWTIMASAVDITLFLAMGYRLHGQEIFSKFVMIILD